MGFRSFPLPHWPLPFLLRPSWISRADQLLCSRHTLSACGAGRLCQGRVDGQAGHLSSCGYVSPLAGMTQGRPSPLPTLVPTGRFRVKETRFPREAFREAVPEPSWGAPSEFGTPFSWSPVRTWAPQYFTPRAVLFPPGQTHLPRDPQCSELPEACLRVVTRAGAPRGPGAGCRHHDRHAAGPPHFRCRLRVRQC